MNEDKKDIPWGWVGIIALVLFFTWGYIENTYFPSPPNHHISTGPAPDCHWERTSSAPWGYDVEVCD